MKVPEKPLKNIKNPKMVYLATLQVQKTAKKGLKNDFFSNVLTKITVLHSALSGQRRK